MAQARSVSPGAALLRTSRLFSLPSPLPKPHREEAYRLSETATDPYPTRQIISTPSEARRQGDWGLKRPLPLRTTTRTTYPMIRLNQVDSIEQVTDFNQAADLGMTLRKFQAMNIPITVPSTRGGYNPPKKSVFEDDFDFTAPPEGGVKDDVDSVRWKFKGPWLAGLTDGELQAYIQKHVRSRRPEFRRFLKGKLAQELNETAAQKVKDSGEGNTAQAQEISASAITEEQLTNFIRRLRDDRPRLYKLISQFLDLAPLGPPSAISEIWRKEYLYAPMTVRAGSNPYAQEGPPMTHPSAGLSYLRTSSFLENHPLYGPQAKHTPVEARVVAPRHSNGSRGAKLGVGGFVTNVPGGDSTFNASRVSSDVRQERVPGLERLDPSIRGGAKVWVETLAATVNSKGQTIITVGETDRRAPEIAKELAGGEPITFKTTPEKEVQRGGSREEQRRGQLHDVGVGSRRTSVMGSSRTYGLSPEDLTFER